VWFDRDGTVEVRAGEFEIGVGAHDHFMISVGQRGNQITETLL
jgi:hypothetical protein